MKDFFKIYSGIIDAFIKKDMPNPVKIFLKILIFPFFIMLSFFVRSAIKSILEPPKYPSTKYKKVIKEGILWDSIEYHERD